MENLSNPSLENLRFLSANAVVQAHMHTLVRSSLPVLPVVCLDCPLAGLPRNGRIYLGIEMVVDADLTNFSGGIIDQPPRVAPLSYVSYANCFLNFGCVL
jgi:hypothetical protein